MPYIDRNESGELVGYYASKQRDGQELIEDGHADISKFENRGKEKKDERKMIRQEVNDFAFQQAIARLKAKGKTFQHH